MAIRSARVLPALPLFAFTSAVSVFFAAIFWQRLSVNPNSDIHEHISYASKISGLTDILSPHFLFQILIIGIDYILPLGLWVATALLLGACYGLMSLFIVLEMERRAIIINMRTAFATTLGVLVASHIFIFTLEPLNLYYNYLVPISYHNPTQQLNKFFAISIFFLYGIVFLERAHVQRRGALLAALGALCVLSAVAKPSFLIAFLPISGLLAGADFFRARWQRVFDYSFGVGIPSAAILAWQFWMTYNNGVSGIEFEPFAIFADPTQYIVTLPLTLAFPIAALVLHWSYAKRTPTLLLAWAFLGLGLVYTLLLVETGDRRMHGNFAWTAQTGAFLVYVESLLLMMKARTFLGSFNPIVMTIFLVHVIFGFVFAFVNMYLPDALWV